jgi:hypothetical protein
MEDPDFKSPPTNENQAYLLIFGGSEMPKNWNRNCRRQSMGIWSLYYLNLYFD